MFRYAAAQGAPEPPGGFPNLYEGTPAFVWRGGAVAPTGEYALVPECDRDRILCHTGGPVYPSLHREEVGLGKSCAELGQPEFGMVLPTSDRPNAYDRRTAAGYREGAIRCAAARQVCRGCRRPLWPLWL